MKVIPILFSTPMVQAILEGRKGQTRRILKHPRHIPADHIPRPDFMKDKSIVWFQNPAYSNVGYSYDCPYGKPGDIIWVRESFRVNTWVPDDGEVSFRYEADGAVSPLMMVDTEDSECENFNKYWEQSCDDLLKAGYETTEDERFEDYDYKALRLRPNIFLRKVAARIWLQVTDVRVERLQDISEEDAKAEGVEKINDGAFPYKHYGGSTASCADAKTSYRTLWLEINGDESWDLNPFVWVISFEVLSTTGKPSTLTEKMEG